jgi:cytochrome c-type biogenesis protein CcmH/NrfG
MEHVLEKGILQQIILWKNEHAYSTLKLELSKDGGNSLLWYLTGVAFGNMKTYSEALTAFDKAAEAGPNAEIIRQIKRNQRIINRRMRK